MFKILGSVWFARLCFVNLLKTCACATKVNQTCFAQVFEKCKHVHDNRFGAFVGVVCRDGAADVLDVCRARCLEDKCVVLGARTAIIILHAVWVVRARHFLYACYGHEHNVGMKL